MTIYYTFLWIQHFFFLGKKVQSKVPSDVEKLKTAGNEKFKLGQYASAIEEYTKAIEKIEKGMLCHIINL